MTIITEFAPAKINLTLEILGARPDGYHELRSLVAFAADACDRLDATPAAKFSVESQGPFGGQIAGRNIVAAALTFLAEAAPGIKTAAVLLEKNLPVASGIGGGSADAAAVLRLLNAFDPEGTAKVDYPSICRKLGADVPVCFEARASFMSGIGNEVAPVDLPPGIAAVLVNPLLDMPADKTKRVFRALNAPLLAKTPAVSSPPVFSSVSDVIAYASAHGNGLEPAARDLFPMIGEMLAALDANRGCALAQLSGAGPTCFGLFATIEEANAVRSTLAAHHPDWWIRSTALV